MTCRQLAQTKHPTGLPLNAFDRVWAGLWSLVIVFSLLSMVVVLIWLQWMPSNEDGVVKWGIPSPQSIDFFADETTPVVANAPADVFGMEDYPDSETPELAKSVQAVTDLPSKTLGLLATATGTNEYSRWGNTDSGPFRKVNPHPGAERWSIEYESESLTDYLAQLSAIGVEIGFVSKVTDDVEIVFGLSSAPQVRHTTKGQERRVYFIQANGKLREWDLRTGLQAGVKPAGKIMCQFYPHHLANELIRLEAAAANERGLAIDQIQRTLFKVRPSGDSFEYYVADVVVK